jgi:hypothetical protein
MAATLSLITLSRQSGQHSDTLTYEVIRSAYSDFLQLMDLRAQYPEQGHMFETPDNYERNKIIVRAAAGPRLATTDGQARLLLEEGALAERIMTMFEHSYYQWKHATENAHAPRIDFLKAVLDYFTARVLTNPRLLWYWSQEGANLRQHYEAETIAYYDEHVLPAGRSVDAQGPFGDLVLP